MKKRFLLFLSLVFFTSCNTKQESITNVNTTKDVLTHLQVTVLDELPESLKSKTIVLDTMPEPKTVLVPKNGGITKMLPFLQNEKGEPILNSEGKHFIMGEGGKSNFTNFTTNNGLALDAVSCSVIDRFGNLWFGTFGGGVSRYDGKSFTSFTTTQGLGNNMVWSIIEDKSGNLWFGTYGGGVSRYDGKSFTSFTTEQGLANNLVWSILEDKRGNLWFGTDGGGVSRYDGISFTSFNSANGLVNNMVRSIIEDKNGNLWFGTLGGGVSRYDGKSFTKYTTDQGLGSNSIFSIVEDKNGNLWFGTDGGGVSCYNGKIFKSYTTNQGLANNIVWSILEDKSGNLWFGTYGGGISRYDGISFTSFTTAQGLANNSVYSILEDKCGNLWIGTDGGGVSRYDGKSFTSFTTAQGLANNIVWSILEDKSGNFWFGTNGGGVSRYDGKSFTSYTTMHGLADNIVFSILEDKSGSIWFGTSGSGVCRFDGKSFTTYNTTQGLANNNVRSIIEDKSGNLWFGTVGGGVSRFDGKSFTTFTTLQGLANNRVYSILMDRNGYLWFGTYGGGVSHYDGKSFTTFTTAHGLANNMVYGILEDKKGNLWFGTDEGLSMISAGDVKKFEKEKNKKTNKNIISSFLFKSFKIADGLPDDFVTNVIQLTNGKIAISTNLGITVFNVSNNYSKLNDIEIYNSNTGYPVKDVNVGQNCMLLDRKGIIWAGTGSENSALIRFDYMALQKKYQIPTLVIQNIKIDEEPICWNNLQSKGIRKNIQDSATALLQNFFAYGKCFNSLQNLSLLKRFGNIKFDGITKFYPLPENLQLPSDHNHISFDFVAIETSKPFLVNYQYKLEGYDKDWSPLTNRSNASFGNINEGKYTFRLKAQGINGVWCKPISYSFKVLPPWYRTWWAYFIYILLFIMFLLIFIKWRERNLRNEKEKLEKIVEERTAMVEKQNEELIQKNILVEKEKQRSDNLLLNILPEEVAEELKAKGFAEAKQYDEVTVLFTDFKDFTRISEIMSPKELVEEIHSCFKAIDNIIGKYNIEKIKTIGDSYMCAGGLPIPNKTHAADIVSAGLEILQYIQTRIEEKNAIGKEAFHIRIGIHTGPVVAGIVGIKKFAYDIWGDTVNTASRMEANGEIEKVNISGTTYELIKEKFTCIYRGKILVRGKGELDMYFVEG